MSKNGLIISGLLLFATFGCKPTPTASQEDGAVKATYVHQYGVEVADADEWHARGSSGQIKNLLKNGATLTQSWQDGKLQGLSTLTFPHSQITHMETFYDKGNRVWLQVNYPSGMPKKQDTYLPGNTQMVSTWYEDGSPKSSEEFKDSLLMTGDYFTREQELETQVQQGNGERIRRDGHGQLVAKDEIENGKRTLEIVYYANDMPQKYIPYHDGKVQGQLKTFLPGGEPDTIEEWQNDLQNGSTVMFRNGERVSIVPYVNGKKEGIEERFRPGTDTVTEQITWKDDERHGPSVLFVDQEKIISYYYDGKKVSRIEFAELDTGRIKR